MAHTLVQFDFPYSGPWGAEMAGAMADLAHDIAAEDGLVWKIWTENRETGRAGGIYVFETPEAAAAYTEKHSCPAGCLWHHRHQRAELDVNSDLSAITRAPL